MLRELECIPELSAPTAFGSLRSLHNGRPSPRVDRARPEEGVSADSCLGGPCSPGVCAVVWCSAGNGEDSASGCTTLPTRTQTKPSTHGLSPTSGNPC